MKRFAYIIHYYPERANSQLSTKIKQIILTDPNPQNSFKLALEYIDMYFYPDKRSVRYMGIFQNFQRNHEATFVDVIPYSSLPIIVVTLRWTKALTKEKLQEGKLLLIFQLSIPRCELI